MTWQSRHGWQMMAILNFWISPKLQEIAEIERKVRKAKPTQYEK